MGREMLLVVDPVAPDLPERLAPFVTVDQRLPPRLLVVRGEADRLDHASRLPGVVAAIVDRLPERVLDQLDPTERLFAQAWVAGRRPKVGRPGDGLPWDAPGFEPPDPPKSP